MARERRVGARMYRAILFTLKFRRFKRTNYIFLLLAAVVIVFQVVFVSRFLMVRSYLRRFTVYEHSINSTENSTVGVRRAKDQINLTVHLSLPALTRYSRFYSEKNLNWSLGTLRTKHFSRTTTQKLKTAGKILKNNIKNETLNSTVSPTLDYRILHEYYPPVNFSVVIPHVVPKIDVTEVFLLVLVNSATEKTPNAKRRQAIRKTWGNVKKMSNIANYGSSIKHSFPFKAIINHSFRLVFLIGKSHNQTLNEEIEEEARTYNDLVIGNFQDIYNNLIIKVYMGFKWTENFKCKFIMKGDDDIYIYLPRLMMVLNQAPARFFGGYVTTNAHVLREISNKHAISKKYFSEDYYPPYCGGAFYIFSHNLIPQFLSLTEKFKPFHVEDAYLGILLREMGIRPLFMPGFHLSNWMSNSMHSFNPCDWATAIALGHKFNSSEIEYVHGKLPLYEPSRLTAKEWQACKRKSQEAISDNMLPTIYGILFSLAMILVYITVAFLPSQYEYEEQKFIFKKKRRHYYPFIYRPTR